MGPVWLKKAVVSSSEPKSLKDCEGLIGKYVVAGEVRTRRMDTTYSASWQVEWSEDLRGICWLSALESHLLLHTITTYEQIQHKRVEEANYID